MKRLALTGAGSHCQGNHAPALAKYRPEHPDQVELVAVCDLVQAKAERFVRDYGFQTALRHRRTDPEFMSETAIHSIDALREIGGEIVEVESEITEGETYWFHVRLTYQSGAIGALDVMPTDGSVEERYELFGDGYRADMRVGPSAPPRLRGLEGRPPCPRRTFARQ